jgi:hypothetical protein
MPTPCLTPFWAYGSLDIGSHGNLRYCLRHTAHPNASWASDQQLYDLMSLLAPATIMHQSMSARANKPCQPATAPLDNCCSQLTTKKASRHLLSECHQCLLHSIQPVACSSATAAQPDRQTSENSIAYIPLVNSAPCRTDCLMASPD